MVLAVAGAVVALPVHPLPGRCLGWVAIAAVLLSDTRRPPPQGLDMTVLDVGHGLAVVVRTQSYALLYDAGARYRSGFDTGSQIVVPALRALGIESLDTVIVSHADNDHAGGLAAVASQFPDARIIAGADVDWPGSLPCSQGQRWQRDGVTFEILHPSGSGHLRGNDGSCVLRIRAASGAALLTGDIEVAGERALVSAVEDLAADVVVVPHHGSSTSSTAALIQATRPRYAVVSAAHNNRWGFPRPEVGRRWESAGAEVLVTAASGAVTVEFGRSGLTVREARARSPRYWRAPSG
jgi:competence protein ComEC